MSTLAKIDADTIQKAEKILALRGQIAGMEAVHETANVDSDAVAALVVHHVRGTLLQRMPNLDPRIEPPLNTLLAHFFMVGILCERIRTGNEEVPR